MYAFLYVLLYFKMKKGMFYSAFPSQHYSSNGAVDKRRDCTEYTPKGPKPLRGKMIFSQTTRQALQL